MTVIPETAPQLCQGCGEVFPPDPEDKRRGVCPKCHGPLLRVAPEAVYPQSHSPGQPTVGPGSPGWQ